MGRRYHGFQAFRTLSFPWSAIRPAMLSERARHPAQSANPVRNTIVTSCYERFGDLSSTEIRTFERCRIGIVSGSDQRLAAVNDRRTRKVKCDNCPLSGFTLDRNVAEV